MTTKRGNRIIYDTTTGKVIHQTGEAKGDILPHDDWHGIAYIEIPYGAIDYSKKYIAGVDLKTKRAIIKNYEVELTEQELEMIRMKEDTEIYKVQGVLMGFMQGSVVENTVKIIAKRIATEGLNPITGEIFTLEFIVHEGYKAAVIVVLVNDYGMEVVE
ncbi:hypothetical protein [Lysinibacillus sp. NPDC047702]|uniref:hypothetical protein n=1 Tax=unclassified Lysinibacillus TaxID=2636778 RepID=UPI003D02A738